MDYTTLDDTTLEATAIDLQNRKDAILDELRLVAAERIRRANLKAAQALVDSLTPEQKAAYAQVLGVTGAIPSGEVVGTPGS